MESQRAAAPANAPETNVSRDQTPVAPPNRSHDREGWLATPVIAVIAVVCCTGPLLLGALAASGSGAWLAAHGYVLGTAAMVALPALLVWRIKAHLSRE
jgi:hypothetical protein